MHPSKSTFIVLNWKRPWNIPVIARNAIDYGFGQVVVWDNSGDITELEKWILRDNTLDRIRVLSSQSGNQYTMGRYFCAQEAAKFDTIAVCDDDYLVTKKGWDHLFTMWDGQSIIAQLPRRNNQYEAARSTPYVNLGYGALFDRTWAPPAFHAIDQYTDQEEQDTIIRKADRAFTTMHSKRRIIVAREPQDLCRLMNPDNTYSETDASSIHLRQDHLEDSHRVVSWALGARSSISRITLD